MILKKVKIVGAYPEPGGGYVYDLEIPDGIEFGEQKWIRPATHAGWGWDDLGADYTGVVSTPTDGRGAGLFAGRSSSVPPGSMYSVVDFLAVQDMPAHRGKNTIYFGYGETWRKRLAEDGTPVDPQSIAHGFELAAINEQPTVPVDPDHPNLGGLVEILRLMAEGLGDGPWHDISTAFTVGNSSPLAKFQKVFNVMAEAITPGGEFIALKEGVALAGFYKSNADGTMTRTARLTVIDGKLKLLKEDTNETADVVDAIP